MGLLLVLGVAGWWFAQRLLDPARASKPFRIGYQDDPPYQYVLPNGAPAGPAIDILTEAARERDVPIQWVESPEGPESSLESGRVDLWPYVGILPERKKSMHISDPWVAIGFWMVSLESSGISRPQDTAGRTVWLMDPPILNHFVQSNFRGAHLIHQDTNHAVLEGVCLGRADAGIISGAREEADELRNLAPCRQAHLRFYMLTNTYIEFGVGASRRRSEDARAADAIRAQIGKMAADGSLSAISYHWFQDPGNEAVVIYYLSEAQRKNLDLGIGICLLAVLFVLLGWQTLRVRAARRAADAANVALEEQVAERTAELTQTNEQLRLEISERNRSEQALRQTEEKYRSIFENAVDGIFQSTPEGRFLSVNPAMAQMYGYTSPEEMIRSVTDIAGQLYVYPEQQYMLWQHLQSEGVVRAFETQVRRKDGSVFCTSETLRVARDAQGNALYYEGIIEDITGRKRLGDQLRQAQKMEVVGRLAGGMAHDFNNLLTIIISYSQLLQDMAGSDPSLLEKAEAISKAGLHASALTRQLLAFSRRQIIQPTVLNLNELISDMGKMLKRLLRENIELTISNAPNLEPIRSDRGQIEQVIMNLVINARDAMPGGGRLTLETANATLGEEFARHHAGAKPGSYVHLTVSDTGSGIDAETQAHVFEPFFTTKGTGEGTGLGLATVHGILQEAGGFVILESAIGQGTTLHVYLPRTEGAPVKKARRGVASPPRGSEAVLVVEDQDGVRSLVCEILEKSGYKVFPARDGFEALLLSLSRKQRLDLLITDVVMPQMGGQELARTLAPSRPEMKVLFMSGYTVKGIDSKGASNHAFIPKPFSPEELVRKVRRVLDTPRFTRVA